MGKKKIFLQFGNPAFITVLIYNSGFCLQYLDSLFIIYQSTHAWCQTISSLMTERCPDKCSYWVKNISLLSIVTKGIRYSRHTGGVLEDRLCLQSGNLPHLLLPQPTGIPSQMVPGERPLTSLHCLLLKGMYAIISAFVFLLQDFQQHHFLLTYSAKNTE